MSNAAQFMDFLTHNINLDEENEQNLTHLRRDNLQEERKGEEVDMINQEDEENERRAREEKRKKDFEMFINRPE